MPIEIVSYATEHIEAVSKFNDRLALAGITSRFPESPVSEWLPKLPGRRIYQESFLALDETAAVRGAYILKHQDFWLKDKVVSVGDVQFPVSEGTIDRRYAFVAPQLLRHALQRQPLLFGLGMGGQEQTVAKLFQAAGWSIFSVPFFFRIVRPVRFLRNISLLRRNPLRRRFLDMLAFSGMGWLGVKTLQIFQGVLTSRISSVDSELVDEFSGWADEIWYANKERYGFSAVRDVETLQILYPKSNPRFLRLKVSQNGKPIGWAVLLDTQLTNHRQFGNMRLGSIVDCFAHPEDAVKVIWQSRIVLEQKGVDLIVSNQAHQAWGSALKQCGFLPGPSNFAFTSSPQLTKAMHDHGITPGDCHINRGDGDGPINL